MNQRVKEKVELKVYVRMHDGERILGYVFVSVDERLQDIMNDGRMFIPLHVDEHNSRSLVMLSKRYIQQVEEVRPDEVVRAKPAEVLHERRSGQDRRHSFNLELEEDFTFGRRKKGD